MLRSEPLEYKYIISKGDAVTWQPGRNLVLTLSEGAQVRYASCQLLIACHHLTLAFALGCPDT